MFSENYKNYKKLEANAFETSQKCPLKYWLVYKQYKNIF